MNNETQRYCKDCKHYKHTPSLMFCIPNCDGVHITEKHECFRVVSLVTGMPVASKCENERDSFVSGCAKEGRYFEPIDIRK